MTYTQVFEEQCPIYLVYGMTYEQYWYGEPMMARAYAQAHLMRRKLMNEEAWLNGLYVCKAMGVVLENGFGKKKANYFDQPLDIFPKTKAEKDAEVRAERKKLVAWLSGLQKAFNKKHNMGSDGNGNNA